MKRNKSPKSDRNRGLFVLGALYPAVTGGMEIFNYYFINYQIRKKAGLIYYLGEQETEQKGAHFVLFRKIKPTRLFYPIQFFWTICKYRNKVDYAYLSYAEQSWIINYSQSLILRLFNIPYITTIHWGKEPDWSFKYPYVSYFRHAHAVIGVSVPICTYFKRAIPDLEFIYIPPLVPFECTTRPKTAIKEQLGYLNQEKIILFVGSLKPMKNPDKIIEAFWYMGVNYLETNNLRMIFAGGGEMKNELKNMVDRYELGRYIRFEGLVSREHIPDYYKAADYYIISSDYEGTSLSLLEAMFNRLAIIASDAPGINGMLQNETNALLYETANIQQLGETLKRIIADPTLAEKLSENAYKDYCSQYSYENMMARYESVFSSI